MHDLKIRKSKAVILKLYFEKAYYSVSWPFLRRVLLAKEFDGSFVHRIMQLVSGGHTTISVNGQVSKYFANGRGLRQGDPASPILFNFVADALSRILSRAANHGHISPVISHLNLKGLLTFNMRTKESLLGKGLLMAHQFWLLMAHYRCAISTTPLEYFSNGAPQVRH